VTAPTTEPASGTTGLPLQELRNTTELLERQVVAAHRATAEEIDERRPAIATDASAWFAYALWLAERQGGAVKASTRAMTQVLHESLADEPASVLLADGKRIAIHPKSLDTLLVLEGLDADLRAVIDAMRDLGTAVAEGAADSAAGAEFLAALLTRRSLQFFVWILAEPGPGLPFAEGTVDANPPEWTRALHGRDVEAIVRAHLQVNRTDLDFLASAFPADERPGTSRLPLSGFLGAYANEIGEPPHRLMRDWTLRSTFAAVIARGQSTREAMAQSKRAAE
jgi:hypothetical protein